MLGLLPDFLAGRLTGTPRSCWRWEGARIPEGYGQITIGGKIRFVHRVVYEWFCGPIPEGLQIDHLCRNTTCANPMHLEPVTPQVNSHRGVGVGAVNVAKTHCPRGHAYDARNTYVRADRSRDCRACQRLRNQRSR